MVANYIKKQRLAQESNQTFGKTNLKLEWQAFFFHLKEKLEAILILKKSQRKSGLNRGESPVNSKDFWRATAKGI